MRLSFEDFVLDTERYMLTRAGTRIPLEPQVFDLLVLLAGSAGRLVTKDEIVATIWKDRAISDAALSSRIKAARRALGDTGRDQRLIGTEHGRGFRFLGAVSRLEPGPPVAPAPLRHTGAGAAPAIAVMPFDDFSPDRDGHLLADGVTEEITTGLARFRWFTVIGRGSAAALHGRGLGPGAFAAALGVGYVVQGSVLRAGRRVRVHVQLVDAVSGTTVLAERFDHDDRDLLPLLDHITDAVVGVLEPGLLASEAGRATRTAPSDRTAWQLFVEAHTLLAGPGRDANRRARLLVEAAIAREPEAARCHASLAITHLWDAFFGWSDQPAATLANAVDAALRAVALGPSDPWCWTARGACMLLMRDHDAALADLRRAVDLGPSSALAHGTLALALAFSNAPAEALAVAARAHRISPGDRRAVIWIDAEAIAAFLLGKPADALAAGRRIVALDPDYPAGHRIIAASAAVLGDRAAADLAVAAIGRLLPGHRASDTEATLPFLRPADAAAYAAALAKAGLPP